MTDQADLLAAPEPEPEASQDSFTLPLAEATMAAPLTPPPSPSPAPPPAPAPATQPYRVLARKYRPQSFSQLIGQEAMVQTLANAIKRDRLAHAFLMTGVRGVGKTSTARLIAKALNCIGPDGQGGPTIDPCGQCEPCRAIAEGRHIDVIEMDAASHTGVDDVREIIEAVRYAAVSARYKLYIIDEVHMLSRNAFNALLKTLEEPPAHVKFLFATTEVEKLPVTVLSRCQRFDLKRIPAALLATHFAQICAAEQVTAEPEALGMIAEAAEGSVRDGLSILDQAIAHGAYGAQDDPAEAPLFEATSEVVPATPTITASAVRAMLGLADRAATRRLFGHLLGGEALMLLDAIAAQHALGVEPLALLRAGLMLTHRIALSQLGRASDELAQASSPEERAAIAGWAQRLSAGQVHRLWQLLLKGYDEVRLAPDPLVAAEMALLRCLHANDLPDPASLARQLAGVAAPAGATPAAGGATSAGSAEPVAVAPPQDWRRLVERVERAGALLAANLMRMQVRVVALTPGRLRFCQAEGFTADITAELRAALAQATGESWVIERVHEDLGAPTLVEEDEATHAAARAAVRRAPLVAAAFAAFPEAEFIEDDTSGRDGWARQQRG